MVTMHDSATLRCEQSTNGGVELTPNTCSMHNGYNHRMANGEEIFRGGGRGATQAREVRLTPGFVATAEGSVLIEVGHTRVLCNATV